MKILKGPVSLDPVSLLTAAKSLPDIHKAGMILLHNGIVRGFTTCKEPVEAIEVNADEQRLSEILTDARQTPGIVFVDAEICTGTLSPGDDVMLLCVAGDVRGNVIDTMRTTLDRIKAEVTAKKEHIA